LAGVYLPVLHDARNCCKSPVALIYTDLTAESQSSEALGIEPDVRNMCLFPLDICSGHFSAVVGLDPFNGDIECQSQPCCFPLVNIDMSPLPLRYSTWSRDVETEVLKNDGKSKLPASELIKLVSASQDSSMLHQYLDANEEVSSAQSSCSGEDGPQGCSNILVAYCRPSRPDLDSNRIIRKSKEYTASTVYTRRAQFLDAILEEKIAEEARLKRQLRNIEVLYS
jgi:hypothetical protein